MTGQREGRRSGRRAVVVGVCLVAVLGAGAGTWAVLGAEGAGSSASASERDGARHHATAPVTKGDLTETKIVAGTLGYGAPVPVASTAAGTLTWLPRPGQVVHRDEPLFALDEQPVRAMYGAVPLWRELRYGVEGQDVHQLNENLAALGYDVSVDAVFGKRTLAAVKRWQGDRGLERTGVLTANDVAFVDGEVRVAAVSGVLGQPASGEVLSVTSTKRVVSATVPQRDADRLAVGTSVMLRINGAGAQLQGTVVDATPAQPDDGGGQPDVDVTIDFDPGRQSLPEAASVQVEAAGRSEEGVLSVPVAALVAGPGGRFAVDVERRGGGTDRVTVQVGFVAQGRAAVTGDVHEGDRVVVPS